MFVFNPQDTHPAQTLCPSSMMWWNGTDSYVNGSSRECDANEQLILHPRQQSPNNAPTSQQLMMD